MIPRPPLAYPDQPVHAFLQQAADIDGEATAIRFNDQTYSYRELDGVANAITRALAARGFSDGDRAALVVSNRPEWVMAQHGILQAGGAVVMPNPMWKDLELAHAFGLTQPKAVFADAALVPLVEAVGAPPLRICVDDPVPRGWLPLWQLVAESSGSRPTARVFDLDRAEAALPFSSGTTGLPKAVRHSHRSLVAGTITWKSAARVVASDRLQFTLPLFHIYGLAITGSTFAARATLRLFARFDVDAALSNIERERITLAFAAAPVATAIANHPDLESFDLSSLRYMLWAATPLSREVADRVTARSGIRWLQAYGSTEGVALHCNPEELPDQCRLDSPGLPVSDLEVRVVDLETGADVEPGAEGEIVVRGAQIMLGYLPDSADDEAFLPGHWLRTGDVGWVEPEGWIHITDRAKEMIKASGFAVAPGEIEHVLSTHDAVADCAVYGVPDVKRGEAPRAAVVRAPGYDVTEGELMTFVAERLAGYKHLRDVRFVEEIPRTASGKVLRRVLMEQDAAL